MPGKENAYISNSSPVLGEVSWTEGLRADTAVCHYILWGCVSYFVYCCRGEVCSPEEIHREFLGRLTLPLHILGLIDCVSYFAYCRRGEVCSPEEIHREVLGWLTQPLLWMACYAMLRADTSVCLYVFVIFRISL